MPPDGSAVASVYAPIMFPPAGVLVFKHNADGEQYINRLIELIFSIFLDTK